MCPGSPKSSWKTKKFTRLKLKSKQIIHECCEADFGSRSKIFGHPLGRSAWLFEIHLFRLMMGPKMGFAIGRLETLNQGLPLTQIPRVSILFVSRLEIGRLRKMFFRPRPPRKEIMLIPTRRSPDGPLNGRRGTKNGMCRSLHCQGAKHVHGSCDGHIVPQDAHPSIRRLESATCSPALVKLFARLSL